MKGWKDIKAVWFEFKFTSYGLCVHAACVNGWQSCNQAKFSDLTDWSQSLFTMYCTYICT